MQLCCIDASSVAVAVRGCGAEVKEDAGARCQME